MVLAIMLLVQPAFAVCSNARLVQADFIYGTTGIPSYNAAAWFWALGDGGTHNSGTNVGSTDGFGYGYGWFNAPGDGYATYEYAYVSASWATVGVVGCVDLVADPRCTAILASDEADGEGYFAFLTKLANIGGNYQDYGAVTMTSLPKPNITGSTRVDAANVNVTVACPSQATLEAAGGFSLDPACADTVVQGCNLYTRTVARGGEPAADRELTGWTRVGTGAAVGTAETVTVTCSGNQDVYLTSALVFDSGFELRYGGKNSTRVECGPNLANPVRRLQDGTTPTRKKSRRTN
jgi:hypothetical protein